LQELGIDLILARSPQAKGRVERFFETAQDRWVKEMRLADVRSRAQANALAQAQLIPQFNQPPLHGDARQQQRRAPATGTRAQPGSDPERAGSTSGW
jgi:hypothetical protein